MDGKNEMLVATLNSVLTWQGLQTSMMIDKEKYLTGMISLNEYKEVLKLYDKVAIDMAKKDSVLVKELKEALC